MSKSANKRFTSEQERIARKFHIPTENPFQLGWTFNTWYEKVIFISLMILGMWKLFELFFF